MKLILTTILIALASGHVPTELPNKHQLLKDENGEYYIKNKYGVSIVEPSIQEIGYNKKWIITCAKNGVYGATTKRIVFMKAFQGGSIDTINKENWEYFLNEFPELKEVKMIPIGNEKCH